MSQRWNRRPEDSNWGDFGGDDQVGRLHLITPARRRAAASEIREGLSFALSLPLDVPGGNGLFDGRTEPKRFAGVMFDRPLSDVFAAIGGPFTHQPPGCRDVGCDDGITMFLQYSTQWDALCHVGALFDADGDGVPERQYYNGWRGDAHMRAPEQGGPYAGVLGIDNMATTGVQGRGVLVDLEREFGLERRILGYDDLMLACERQRVEIETGDILCLCTGFAEVLLAMNKKIDRAKMERTAAIIDGSDPKLQRLIVDSGIVAIAADNVAIEAELGDKPCALDDGYTLMPLHHLCIFKLGMHLGELWYFRDLAEWLRAHGRNRFFLTAPPLRLPGCVGSPVTPVATV
jgi:kynurenine formamidase